MLEAPSIALEHEHFARAAGVLATTSSVSRNAASASFAASAGVQGGASRVFARPGSGSFAITNSAIPLTPAKVLSIARGSITKREKRNGEQGLKWTVRGVGSRGPGCHRVRVSLFDRSNPPPGPFQRTFWRSPLRGPWLTSVLGLALLVAIPVVAVTGFLSNDAYYPRLGSNWIGRPLGPLDIYLFSFPSHPSWGYALSQGLHVTIGLAAFPIVLAKLWSVIPKLFEWPPVRGPAHALERLSLALLVGGALFEFATGILNIQYSYPFGFFFTTAHYYGAWVFTAHSCFTRRQVRDHAQALSARPDVGIARTAGRHPSRARRTAGQRIDRACRRGQHVPACLLGTVGAGSLFLLFQGAGQSIGGPLRSLAVFAPRACTVADRTGSR